jgi:DNA-directed RNA polymerase specialized sigma24 family protein
VRGFEQRASFRGESSATAWVHGIRHNLAVDRARRDGRETLVERCVQHESQKAHADRKSPATFTSFVSNSR